MQFLLYFALGILLVLLLHTLLSAYAHAASQRVRKLGVWLAGIGVVLASIFSPALRKLIFFALLAMPWLRNGGVKENSSTTETHGDLRMGAAEAREVLDVRKGATAQEIEEAYRRLMLMNHPDQGGSEYFAKKLNEARDVLLKRKS